MFKLCLTLGHNASAVLIENDKVLCGYEEERLSRVKSDSSFPVLAIEKILHYYPEARTEVNEIFVSHWFWSWDLPESKYYKPKYLAVNFPEAKITSVSEDITHHDLHARSVWNFCDGDQSGLTIVADGFGNYGECLSIYVDGTMKHRSYNVYASLGLMYQYAVGYLGMKENQDEYKLLGYEQRVTKAHKRLVEPIIDVVVSVTTEELLEGSEPQLGMNIVLPSVRRQWYDRFDQIVCDSDRRATVGYFVQQVLERTMMNILKTYPDQKDIKVSGGVFYNVKLNNMILRYSRRFEANPLSGDQGCALGFTDVRYDDLYWGKRDITELSNTSDLYETGMAEIFIGDMEFGPRALGNTTTLALPTMSQVEKINTENGRDTIMPMAPMVTEEYAERMFEDIYKTKKSKHFMIIAYDFISMSDNIRGAAHYDSDRDVYTGRFQIVPGHLYEVVKEHGGILINTSLNAHGQPIIYSDFDYKIMKDKQAKVAKAIQLNET